MNIIIIGCVTATLLIFGTILPMLSVQEAFADHSHPCGMSLRLYIYDSEWRETKRKSAEGQYYPGDGFNVLVVWRASKCLSFSVETPETYGNVVLRSIVRDNMPIDEAKISNYTTSSSQKHFELKVIERETDDGIRYSIRTVSTDTPSVWNIWAENDKSQERFKQAVENRCSREPSEDTRLGCIYGHVELDTEFRDDVCYERTTRLGETIEICSDSHTHKVVFKAKGKAQQCKHQKDPPDRSCGRPYFKYTETEKTFNIRQPHINMTLERDPFHDVFEFSVMNQDKTFYIDDLMGIRHEPIMKYVKNGPIQFVVEVKGDLKPDQIIPCVDERRCNGEQNHSRTDERNYPQTYGHGKRGYHTLNVGDYSFTYTISAYNIGTTLEEIVNSDKCKGNRDKLPDNCIIELSRVDDGRKCLGNKNGDCNWLEDRLLNVTSGTITIHAGPYEPVVKFYSHSIWNTPGIIPPDAETGVTATYFGSTENDILYPERRMRIDNTHVAGIAYNSTFAFREDFSLQPYEHVLITRPNPQWIGFDSHEGNYTTISPRTMMESEGYGTIRLTTPGIADMMLDGRWSSGIANATGYFIPYTNFLGGIDTTYLNNTAYVYPEGYHSIPLNVTVYNSEGNVRHVPIKVDLNIANTADRTFKEYIERKIGEEQDDDRVTEIVVSYVAVNHTAWINSGHLTTYIPRLTHVFLTDLPGYGINSTSNGTSFNGTSSSIPNSVIFYEPEYDFDLRNKSHSNITSVFGDAYTYLEPKSGEEQFLSQWNKFVALKGSSDAELEQSLHLGILETTSPTNITVVAAGVNQTWTILSAHHFEPINIIINTDMDNKAYWSESTLGLDRIMVNSTFGPIKKLSIYNETSAVYCSTVCVVGVVGNNTVAEVMNQWGGIATTTAYEAEPNQVFIKPEPQPLGVIIPIDEIILTTVIVVIGMVVLWWLKSGKLPIYG